MIKLIKIELFKIFHKKSIYIILSISLIFCFLNNYLYWKDYDDNGFYKYEDNTNLNKQKESIKKELTQYDYHNSSDLSTYINLKTKYELIEIKLKYPKNSWQYRKADEYLYNTIYNKEKNITNYRETIKEYNNNNWKYFLNKEKELKEEELNNITKEKNNIQDKSIIKELNTKKESLNTDLYLIKYRLKNNISEDKTYLDNAINKYREYKNSIKYYQEKDHLTRKELIDYQTAKEGYYINEYILKNKKNINKENTTNNQLRNIISDYELFIVLLIIITSSTIICDEFNSGTIKLLLIKPYSRVKILLSKYLTCLIILLLSIIFIVTIQLIIGSIFFKDNNLSLPVVAYHHGLNKLVTYSIWKYMLINISYKLPMLILILTITFSISVLFTQITVSLVLSLLLYLSSTTIDYIALKYNIKWLKYLLTTNWNLIDYSYGKLKEYSYTNFNFSLIVITTYFIVVLIITIINFNKKNIKNI